MNTKHTPGPWTAVRDPNAIMADDWCIGAQGQIDHVAVCSERDARLIAAAPDLLEALKAIIGDQPKDKYGYFAARNAMDDDKRQAARAAIAKATGETE